MQTDLGRRSSVPFPRSTSAALVSFPLLVNPVSARNLSSSQSADSASLAGSTDRYCALTERTAPMSRSRMVAEGTTFPVQSSYFPVAMPRQSAR